jgi:hypothetical protein
MLLRIITLLCFISFYPSNSLPIPIPDTSHIYTDQNAARAFYGIASFTFDQDLVDIAQQITEQCKWTDQSWKTSAQTTYASELGVASTTIGFNKAAASVGSTSVDGWLAQKSKWNCETNTCTSGICGSYTQVVWKNSVRIGCALSKCTTGTPLGPSFTTWEYLLCLYNPAGNMNINGVKQHPFGTELCSGSVPTQPPATPVQPPVQNPTQPPATPVQPPTQPPVQTPTQPPVQTPSAQSPSSAQSLPVPASVYTQQNDARSTYGISSFILDQNLVNIAQEITQQCKWTDSSWKTSAQSTYAQTLGLSSTSLGFNKGAASVGDTSIDGWLAQKSKWNCQDNTCTSGICGSWTQIIWKDSVRIGCALSKCTTGTPLGPSFTTWEYLLCLYNPAGNMNINGVKQHPFGTELDKCDLSLPTQALSAEFTLSRTHAVLAEETAHHQSSSEHESHTEPVLSVGALIGIVVGSILGVAVIVVAAIQLRAKTTTENTSI